VRFLRKFLRTVALRGGSLATAARREVVVLRAKVWVLLANGPLRTFHQRGSQPAVAQVTLHPEPAVLLLQRRELSALLDREALLPFVRSARARLTQVASTDATRSRSRETPAG
jgi:hypothetical protein